MRLEWPLQMPSQLLSRLEPFQVIGVALAVVAATKSGQKGRLLPKELLAESAQGLTVAGFEQLCERWCEWAIKTVEVEVLRFWPGRLYPIPDAPDLGPDV